MEDLIKARGTLLETKHQLKQILPKLLDDLRKRVEEPRTIKEKFKIKKKFNCLKDFYTNSKMKKGLILDRFYEENLKSSRQKNKGI